MSNLKLIEDLVRAVNISDIMSSADASTLFVKAIYALQAYEWNYDMEAAKKYGSSGKPFVAIVPERYIYGWTEAHYEKQSGCFYDFYYQEEIKPTAWRAIVLPEAGK